MGSLVARIVLWTTLTGRQFSNAVSLSPHVRESMKVLDSGSRPLDSGFQLSVFRNPYHSGFWIPNHCGFRIPNHCEFWIPVLWIPDSNSKKLLDSRFSYMGRLLGLKPTKKGTYNYTNEKPKSYHTRACEKIQ